MPWIDPKSNPKAQQANQPSDSLDLPYDGLDDEMEYETLSNSELKKLKFVRWGLRHRKGHYSEFSIDGE